MPTQNTAFGCKKKSNAHRFSIKYKNSKAMKLINFLLCAIRIKLCSRSLPTQTKSAFAPQTKEEFGGTFLFLGESFLFLINFFLFLVELRCFARPKVRVTPA